MRSRAGARAIAPFPAGLKANGKPDRRRRPRKRRRMTRPPGRGGGRAAPSPRSRRPPAEEPAAGAEAESAPEAERRAGSGRLKPSRCGRSQRMKAPATKPSPRTRTEAMKVPVYSLDNKKSGEIELNDSIFA